MERRLEDRLWLWNCWQGTGNVLVGVTAELADVVIQVPLASCIKSRRSLGLRKVSSWACVMGFRSWNLDVIVLESWNAAGKKNGMRFRVVPDEVTHTGVVFIPQMILEGSPGISVDPWFTTILMIVLLCLDTQAGFDT